MLSTSVVFLVAGMVLGRGVLDWVHIESGTEVMARFSELSLFVILFVDGAQLELRELREWPGASPGRALLLGMPLLRVDWLFWSGRFLSPTDRILVSAMLERETVPRRLRQLLRIESGLNDGIASPIAMVLLDGRGLGSGESGWRQRGSGRRALRRCCMPS